jgi:hypothetical protein
MRNTTRHLTDDFHFLRLLKGRLDLLALCNLLMQLLIGLLEFAGALAHLIFQLCREGLSIKQVVLHLVLTSASPQRGPYGTYQSYSVQRTFEQGNVAQAFQQAHAVRLRRRRRCAAGQHDERKVRPGWLALNPPLQSLRSAAKEGLFGHQRDGGTLTKLGQQIVHVVADDAIEFTLCEMLCRGLRIAPYRCEYEDAIFKALFSVCRHPRFPASAVSDLPHTWGFPSECR